MVKMLYSRIKNEYRRIKNEFIKDKKYYSMNLALVKLINNITYRGKILKKINKWSLNKKHKIIMDYLYDKYKYIFDKYKNESESFIYSKNSPIWICWLQGEENAPKIVKNCIDSIRRNSVSHEVILITKYNVNKYINIPSYIIDKFNKSIISPAHFSDIVRMMLIKEYGGLWLDATVYCKGKIPESIYKMPFFSCKSPKIESNYISGFQWTSFILGGCKDSIFFKFMTDFYFEYWKKEDADIDYLFMDYVIALACKYIPVINTYVESLPLNNLDRDYMSQIFNEEFEEEKYKNIIDSDTYFFKLSWRENFKEYTTSGKETFFYEFTNRYEELFYL